MLIDYLSIAIFLSFVSDHDKSTFYEALKAKQRQDLILCALFFSWVDKPLHEVKVLGPIATQMIIL